MKPNAGSVTRVHADEHWEMLSGSCNTGTCLWAELEHVIVIRKRYLSKGQGYVVQRMLALQQNNRD